MFLLVREGLVGYARQRRARSGLRAKQEVIMTEVSVVFPSGGRIDVQNRESVEADQDLSWKVQSAAEPIVTTPSLSVGSSWS